jgi:hypothetical protein
MLKQLPAAPKSPKDMYEPSRAKARMLTLLLRDESSRTDKLSPNLAKDRKEMLLPTSLPCMTDNWYTDPHRATLSTLKEDPTRLKARTEMELPKFKNPKTETTEPSRAKERTDKVLPKLEWPRTLAFEPIRTYPRKLKLLPAYPTSKHDIPAEIRLKERSESELPQLTHDKKEQTLPNFANDRTLMVEPKCKKSITLKWEETFAKCRTLSEELKFVAFTTDKL